MGLCQCSIKIEDLSVRNNNKFILKSISFNVNHGEILALIGKNGSGKTTILKSILNRITYRGRITFFNATGSKISKPKIGYVPQKLIFDKNTPISVLDFFCLNLTNFPVWISHKSKFIKKTKEILERSGATSLINKSLGDLSGGELQKVLLAFALEPRPDILLLDEPSSALDSQGVDYFYSLISSLKSQFHMPIILVSHDINKVIKYSSNYVIIENGKVLDYGNTYHLNKNPNAANFFKI